MKKLVIFLVLILLTYNSFSQNTVSGTILDSISSQVIPFVNVSARFKNIGTVSNAEGFFTLKIKKEYLPLVFSAVGYKTKQVFPNEKGRIKVLLSRANVELNQVVIKASAISPMQSISKIDLELKPVNTAQEILRMMPGLFIAQHEGGGKAEQIFLRGFDMDHGTDISVNVDGMPVNMVSHAHGQGYADLHFLIPETVDNIEFEKGTYNPEYGDFQTGAYINFHTKNHLDNNRVQLEGGMFNTKRLLTMFNLFGKNNNKQSAYIASEYMLTNGFFDMSQNFNRLNSFFKYQNYLSPNSLLSVEANIFKTRWDAAGLIPLRAVNQKLIDRLGTIDSCGGGQTHRNDVIVNLSTQLSPHASLFNRFYFSDYAFDLHSNFTFYLNNPIGGDQIRQKENRKIYGYNFTYSLQNNHRDWNFTTKAGIGFRYDDIDDIGLSNTKNRTTLLRQIQLGDIDETNIYLFANEIIQNGAWLFKIGSRLDYFNFLYIDKLAPEFSAFNAQKYTPSPKLSVAYTLNSKLQLFAKAGMGFHSNDARIIAQTSTDILPKAYGTDVGFISKPTDNLFLTLTAWTLYLEQEYVFSGDEATVEPSGRTFRSGIDFSSHIQFLDWLYARMDINYAIPRSLGPSEGGIYLPLAPILSSVGGIYFMHKSGFNGSLTYRYLGKRPADEYNSLSTQAYTLVDASLNFTNKKYEIGFNIENLLNTEWRDAQFETTSRLSDENIPVTDIDFTPGTPFFLKAKIAVFF